MDGFESKDEVDRGKIWDLVWKYGPMTPGDLQATLREEGVSLTKSRITGLIEHEWFVSYYGMLYIANKNGTRVPLPKVG